VRGSDSLAEDTSIRSSGRKLTMRMCMKRFTGLTNGFSKKVEYLSYGVALHLSYYNVRPIHQTLRGTQAMESTKLGNWAS